MTTDKTPATLDAVRNLIVCDTQFTWAGRTNLTMSQMMDLQARGWVVEGDSNDEFQLTEAGEAVVARALEHGATATLATVKHGGCVQLEQQGLSTSEGGRKFIADYFTRELHRHDFASYITTRLAADFACALAQHLAARQPVGEPERRAPVQGYHGKTIPWRVHGMAWEVYARKYRGQDAEKIASRGGFAVEEMDAFLPGWRDMAEGTPAQAVDLGTVRALLQRRIGQWRSHLPADTGAPGTREIETKAERDYNNDVRIYREGIAVMEEVLAKVDSQAVGK